MKNKFWYKTIKQDNGYTCRYRCWKQKFKDGQKDIFITRHTLIKVNGICVRFYNDAELRRMTPTQKKAIEIAPKYD